MGINVIGTPQYAERKNKNKFLMNALITFMSVYGSISYILSAMNIEYYAGVVFVAIAVECIVCSFLYVGKIRRIVGYLILVGVFAIVVLAFRDFINSGFSHFLNELYNTVDLRYNLGVEKQYYEQYDNSQLTISIFAISIGFVLTIMVNILVSESMNGLFVMLLEGIFMIIPLYFGLEASIVSEIMVVVSPVAALIGKNSRKYASFENEVSYKDKPDTWLMRVLGKTNNKKKIYKNKYNANGYYKCRVMPGTLAKQLLSGAVMMITCIAVVNFITPNRFTSGINNKVERATNKWVRDFAMYGLDSIFSFGESNNGIMDGTFNDGGMLRFNYMTDISVRYVDITGERMFLKSYTGSLYTGTGWKTQNSTYEGWLQDYYKENGADDYYAGDAYTLSSQLAQVHNNIMLDNKMPYQKMEIINVGLPINSRRFLTYFSEDDGDISYLDDESTESEFKRGDTQKIKFYNILHNTSTFSNGLLTNQMIGDSVDKMNADAVIYANKLIKLEEIYSKYVKETYLEQPDVCKKTADEFINDHNLGKYEKREASYVNEMEVANKIENIYQMEYEYTLAPGKTPDDEDFADYFLNNTKQGYCVHFATAAVMIFRELGIPARYVEGYAVDPQNTDEVTALTNYSEWISDNETDGNLITVPVTDASGHAWVEIYVDKIGWIPVDATPTSEEDDPAQATSGLTEFITNIAQSASSAGESLSEKMKLIGENSGIIIAVAVGTVVLLILAWGASIVIGGMRRKRIFEGNDCDKAVVAITKYAIRLLKFAGIYEVCGLTFKEYARIAKEKGMIDISDAIMIIEPVQRKVYGMYSLTKEEQEKAVKGISSMSSDVFDNLKWYKKIGFLLIKRMTVYKV